MATTQPTTPTAGISTKATIHPPTRRAARTAYKSSREDGGSTRASGSRPRRTIRRTGTVGGGSGEDISPYCRQAAAAGRWRLLLTGVIGGAGSGGGRESAGSATRVRRLRLHDAAPPRTAGGRRRHRRRGGRRARPCGRAKRVDLAPRRRKPGGGSRSGAVPQEAVRFGNMAGGCSGGARQSGADQAPAAWASRRTRPGADGSKPGPRRTARARRWCRAREAAPSRASEHRRVLPVSPGWPAAARAA